MMVPTLGLGEEAPDFDLIGVDGRLHSLSSFAEKAVLVVVFTCNHCPYARAYEDRIVSIQRDYAAKGVQVVAINSNDDKAYPEDSFPEMVKRAGDKGFNFPYLRDPDQKSAEAYGAVCTPDFFGYNGKLELQYRGRLDESRTETAPEGVRRDLFEAMKQVAGSGRGPEAQIPSMGCSIKWRGE